jgi:hypothetical protein
MEKYITVHYLLTAPRIHTSVAISFGWQKPNSSHTFWAWQPHILVYFSHAMQYLHAVFTGNVRNSVLHHLAKFE